MAIPGISTPTSAFTGPYDAVRNPILTGYLFNAQLNKPEVSDIVTEKFADKYKMTTLLNRLGAYKPVADKAYSWFVQDRQRASATVSSGVAGLPTASLVLTLDTVAAGANLGYFIVGDLVRTESGVILKVTAVGDAGGFQTITVVKNDGSNITSGDIANAEKIGHVATAFAEGSTGPNGRLFLPSEKYNYTQIFRRGVKVTGSALTQQSWVNGGAAWYFTNEDYMFDEFAYDQEVAVMFGTRSVNAAGDTTTTGGFIPSLVAEGQVVHFTTSTGIAETDLQAISTLFMRQAGGNRKLGLCGSEAMADIQAALKGYVLNGSVSYGNGAEVGLGIQRYNFAGMTYDFMHYPLFDDDKVLPFVSTSTPTKINWRHAVVFLDMGSSSAGEPNHSIMYRELAGEQRKFIHKIVSGMHGGSGDQGGVASNTFDGFEVSVLAEIGAKSVSPWLDGALLPNA